MSIMKMNKLNYAGRISPDAEQSLNMWAAMPNVSVKNVKMTSINEIYFGCLPFHGLKAGGLVFNAVQKIKEGRKEEYMEEWAKIGMYQDLKGQTRSNTFLHFESAPDEFTFIGFETKSHFFESQTIMGGYANMMSALDSLERFDVECFGEIDQQVKAILDKWDAIPFCNITYPTPSKSSTFFN